MAKNTCLSLLIKETIEHSSFTHLLPSLSIIMSTVENVFLTTIPNKSYLCALLIILENQDIDKISKWIHSLILQKPYYCNAICAVISDVKIRHLCKPHVDSSHNEILKNYFESSNIPLTKEELLKYDFVSKQEEFYDIEFFEKVVQRVEHLVEVAPVFYKNKAQAIYLPFITTQWKMYGLNGKEITASLQDRVLKLFPTILEKIPYRIWNTQIVKDLTNFSISKIQTILGLTFKEIEQGLLILMLEKLDKLGVEQYCQQYGIWLKKKIENSRWIKNQIVNEEDLNKTNIWEYTETDLCFLEQGKHCYIFTIEEAVKTFALTSVNPYTGEKLTAVQKSGLEKLPLRSVCVPLKEKLLHLKQEFAMIELMEISQSKKQYI